MTDVKADRALDRTKVLVADDEKCMLDVFVHVLTHNLPGVRADVVANGQEALDAFMDLHYAVILMDINMPVLDGGNAFCLIMKYCEEMGIEKPSVVFCTGFEPPAELLSAISSNSAHCVLRKPVRNEDLVEALRSRLSAGPG